MPIARRLLDHAARTPERIAVRCGGSVRSYGELAGDVTDAAAAWRAAGLPVRGRRLTPAGGRAGDVVAIGSADPVEALTAVVAADLVGVVPLVCEPATHEEVVDALAPAARVRGAATSIEPAGEHAWDAHGDAASAEAAWAGFTSGSSGRPRAVVRSAASWVDSYDAVSALTGITPADTVLVPGSPATSLTAFAALHTLAVGATLQLAPDWSDSAVAACLPGVDVAHLVPHALDAVVGRIAAGDQTRLRTAVVGGAALPDGLRERAAAAGVDVLAYYGAAELSFVAVDTDGTGLRPFPGVRIDVRQRSGADGDGTGELWVRSPWLAHGYLAGAPGPLRWDENGWASVGDLADPGPPLRLRGRADGAVLTGAATVVPEDVEAVLSQVPGVRDVVVVGTRHERLGAVVTAVVEHRTRDDGPAAPRAALEAAARRGLAPAQRPRRWVAVGSLPRTPSGKPARTAIGHALAAGTLDVRPWS
ncbi:acyl-CoA synthetase (AMP-forming)/AMP-acid ligase II [Haloactinopolyspora alba]|uniref:Acyl-CoA synthetase (AMP-forming)/AMP-acid ligase II n=1 Tax=Haloactinopolyspora alba TaxID=648780 RepID=A0A2P8DKW0_9ACTN|nr:AMP-binding protein [Haloactinopolyspora alba]PSK97853.1 acyl-CoA synthetase (AMP-forming)/AMP-acid ligase II [Haloactinopolyspora alba]